MSDSYTFTTTFDLTGYDLSTASLTGAWAIDDAGYVALNGHTISTVAAGNWGGLTSFSDPNLSSDLLQGANTLTITLTSSDTFLEAVRLEGTLFASSADSVSAVPEPMSLALLGSGIAMAGLIRRRR